MSELLEALKQARLTLASKDNWCRFSFAEDAEGNRVPAHHPSAVRWCLTGVLHKVCSKKNGLFAEVYEEIRSVGKEGNPMLGGLCGYNDEHSYEEVIVLLDKTLCKVASREVRCP